MDEKTKDLLAKVLDMDEHELRAALITIVTGLNPDQAIDTAYNYIKREVKRLNREHQRKDWTNTK